jgi:hypothetical protein
MSEATQELRGNASKNNQETPQASKKSSRKKAETVAATPDQEVSVGVQLVNAQKEAQQGLLRNAQANAKVLAEQSLKLTRNLTALEIIKGTASIFEGEEGVTEVTTAFLFGTSESGYQIADAIANLESSQPLLLQAIAPKQLTAAA